MDTKTMVTGMDATYYTVADLKKTTEFYKQMLGEPTQQMEDFVSEWELGDKSAFGLYKGGNAGGNGSAMFAVDDIDAALAKLKTIGAYTGDGEEDITDTPACQMVFGKDPEGNHFILHKRKSAS
ncbi:MAG: hypothetical protein DLM50_00245 [Candidatus Meridianibacter frigidus]|nr:MAG: hypothetical protein DLM50_00245 [Candidatus Eremiobacteraeota bacterium]